MGGILPPSWRIACGNFLFRRRNAVFPLILLTLCAAFPPDWPGVSGAADRWLDLAGLALALCGQGVRATVIGFAYIKRGGLNKRVYADQLVTDGLFGVSRNPLYVGNILTLSGLLVIHGNPWVIGIGLALALFAYGSIVAAEEAFLRKEFGDRFTAYCDRVPRWRPVLGRWTEATAGMRFNWRRVIIKDYGTIGTWLAAAVVLMSYEAVRTIGFAAARPRLATAAVLLALIAVAVTAVRRAKKTGRLTERVA